MCLNPYPLKVHNRRIMVPCGHCVECDIQKSNEWAFRIMLESRLYEHNSFLTLTYNSENLPPKGALSKRDLQLFMKRLRKSLALKFKSKIRFFACGEYGSEFGRCHYHIIIFNFDFPDKFFWKYSKKGFPLYRSPLLEKVWTKGFSTIQDLTFDDMKYCAKYCQKALKFDDETQKPFLQMSQGIGKGALNFSWLKSDRIYVDGHYIKIPRYFLDRLERLFPGITEDIKERRFEVCEKAYTDYVSIENKDNSNRLTEKRKKYLQKFENSLDKDYKLVYNIDKLKKGGE